MKEMNPSRINNRILLSIIAVVIIITATAIFVFASMSKWEQEMVEKNMALCESYARGLLEASEGDLEVLGSAGLLNSDNLSSSEMKLLDSLLKKNSEKQLIDHEGLDGGFYLKAADAFFGYAFPTSPPPVPAYGPPPRSYEIIRNQSRGSTVENEVYSVLQGFDAAIFPLATVPVPYNGEVVGAVWVRIHLEKHLPIVKIKQIVNRTALISIAGFIILMAISSLWTGEMTSIKREINNIRGNPGYRLSRRWGIFGYIAESVNKMLDTIESEHTKREALERQLRQKEKMAYLGNMVAGVAHEVKTPLSIIKTRLQIWQKELATGQKENRVISDDSLKMVIGETDRLSALVNKLLIFASPIDKKIRPADLNAVVSEVVGMMNEDVHKGSAIIEVKPGSELPDVMIDQASVKQVLINVMRNAIDSVDGNGKVTVSTGLDVDRKMALIEIMDDGGGIPEDKLENIFEPFFTLKDNGVGLGLAISYQIIKAHGGEITLQNNPDKGVICSIRLPAKQ